MVLTSEDFAPHTVGEDDLGFPKVVFLSRGSIEVIQNSVNGITIQLVSPTKRVRSSAKKRLEILGPLVVILMGPHCLVLTFTSMCLEGLSMQMIKR